LFAQVKVLVKSGINNVTIDDLDDVEIEGQTWTTVNPFDGSFATASAAKQWVDFDTDELPAEEIESGQRLVFPLSPAPTKVKFGTIEISATVPFSDQTVSFNSILNVGTSYTLVVDVKRCVWARSNIYWNGSEMTFVPAGTDTSKEGYQGLYFKHGSLVGTTPSENYWTSSSRAYVAGNSGYSTYSTWESIPWISSGDVSGYNVGNHTGDICQYINSVYRLPKQGEFNVNAWSRQNYFQSFSGTSADGTYDFISNGRGYIKLPMMGICLPTSGVRWNIGGNPAVYMAAFAGKNGYYWTNAMVALGFTDILSAPYYGNDYPDGGMSVRCVRD
jgi:hypothetical protein